MHTGYVVNQQLLGNKWKKLYKLPLHRTIKKTAIIRSDDQLSEVPTSVAQFAATAIMLYIELENDI